MFQKEVKRTEKFEAVKLPVTEKQANEEIRCVIFIGLFEQPQLGTSL